MPFIDVINVPTHVNVSRIKMFFLQMVFVVVASKARQMFAKS